MESCFPSTRARAAKAKGASYATSRRRDASRRSDSEEKALAFTLQIYFFTHLLLILFPILRQRQRRAASCSEPSRQNIDQSRSRQQQLTFDDEPARPWLFRTIFCLEHTRETCSNSISAQPSRRQPNPQGLSCHIELSIRNSGRRKVVVLHSISHLSSSAPHIRDFLAFASDVSVLRRAALPGPRRNATIALCRACRPSKCYRRRRNTQARSATAGAFACARSLRLPLHRYVRRRR